MVKLAETKGAMEPPVVFTDRQVLEVALELLQPLQQIHVGVLREARKAGIILHPDEEMRPRIPLSQMELIAGVTLEIEDGVKNGWGQQHVLLTQMTQKLQLLARSQQPQQTTTAT